MEQELLKLIHDNEQDAAECRRWFTEATAYDIVEVLDTIQTDPLEKSNRVMKVVLQLAQLKFGEMIEQLRGEGLLEQLG